MPKETRKDQKVQQAVLYHTRTHSDLNHISDLCNVIYIIYISYISTISHTTTLCIHNPSIIQMLMDCSNHTAQSESWDLKLPPQEPTWSQLGVRFAVSEDSFWEGGVAFVIAFVIAFVTTFVVPALDHTYLLHDKIHSNIKNAFHSCINFLFIDQSSRPICDTIRGPWATVVVVVLLSWSCLCLFICACVCTGAH